MTQQLDHIEEQIRRLVEALDNVRRENAVLLQENNKLKADQTAQNERIGELTQRLSNAQQALAEQRGDDPESSQKLRKQIDQYIREIDKCIAWLQNV